MTSMDQLNAKEEAAVVEATEKEYIVESEDGHKHHCHRSGSGNKHSHHHHSSKGSRRKRKIKRFFKKNKYLLINIVVLVLAAAVYAGFAVFEISQYREFEHTSIPAEREEKSNTSVTNSSIHVEMPFFAEEVYLIGDAAKVFLNANSSISKADIVDSYKEEGERLDIGLPVEISFDATGMSLEYSVVSSTVEISESSTFSESLVYTLKSEERSVSVYHLKTNAQYYYRISLALSDRSVVSVQGSFKTADTPRILSIDGIANVRDFGGWKTIDGKTIRQGLLYRGSELDGAVDPNCVLTQKGLGDMLTVFGIRTDMDLRAETDNVHGVDPLGANVEHIYYNCPRYAGAFEDNGRGIVRQIFSDLANTNKYPVYLHCTAGKDRTGTICYLLGGLLGICEEDLTLDYELSILYHGDFPLYLKQEYSDFLKSLKSFEGATTQEKTENYLLSIGVTTEEIASIRNIFLEG